MGGGSGCGDNVGAVAGASGKHVSDSRMTAAAEVASEDFLFHLYRGTELLQDERIHEAKEELEAALRLQPRDPKAEDLLAVTYFRLGMYPRAVEIFSELVRTYPDERTPRVNLALCYLKTGQPIAARQLLDEAVALDPEHTRAWGYLGLANERLGEYAKARDAFARGGHAGMARRMDELISGVDDPSPSTFHEVEGMLADAIAEASTRGVIAPPPPSHRPSARPPTSMRASRPPSMPPPPISLGAFRSPSAPPPSNAPSVPAPEPPLAHAEPASAPTSAESWARTVTFAFPREGAVQDGPFDVRVTVASSFVTRLGHVRALAPVAEAGFVVELVHRRTRGRELPEWLGGIASPLASLRGAGGVWLGAPPGATLAVVPLADESLYVREDALVGFDGALTHESGRLALGDGDAAALVQLRGVGNAILQTRAAVAALELAGASITLRHEQIVGWLGRVVPRALAPSEAPAGQRGLVAFSGDGFVLVDRRTL